MQEVFSLTLSATAPWTAFSPGGRPFGVIFAFTRQGRGVIPLAGRTSDSIKRGAGDLRRAALIALRLRFESKRVRPYCHIGKLF
jgi:hypothetical protein